MAASARSPVSLFLLLLPFAWPSAAQSPIRICSLIKGPWLLQLVPDKVFQWPILPGPNASIIEEGDFYSNYEGFVVDMIKGVFRDRLHMPVQIQLYPYRNGNELLYRVRLGTCDIAITSFFMSKGRELCTSTCPTPNVSNPLVSALDGAYGSFMCCLDFTQPILPGGFSLLAAHSEVKTSSAVKVVTSARFTEGLSWLIIGMFITGHLLWVIERRTPLSANGYDGMLSTCNGNTDARTMVRWKYLDGVKDAMWWASYAAPTMGLGTGCPKSSLGRLVGVFWVLFSVFMFTYFTGLFSAALVDDLSPTNYIQSIDDIGGKTLCVKFGFYDGWWNTSRFKGLPGTTIFRTEAECFELLKKGEVDALMQNYQYIAYLVLYGGYRDFVVTPIFGAVDYAAAFAQRPGDVAYNELKDEVNAAIIDWKYDVTQESSYISSINHWFGGDGRDLLMADGSGTSENYNVAVMASAVSLLGFVLILATLVTLAKWMVRRGARQQEEEEERGNTEEGNYPYGRPNLTIKLESANGSISGLQMAPVWEVPGQGMDDGGPPLDGLYNSLSGRSMEASTVFSAMNGSSAGRQGSGNNTPAAPAGSVQPSAVSLSQRTGSISQQLIVKLATSVSSFKQKPTGMSAAGFAPGSFSARQSVDARGSPSPSGMGSPSQSGRQSFTSTSLNPGLGNSFTHRPLSAAGMTITPPIGAATASTTPVAAVVAQPHPLLQHSGSMSSTSAGKALHQLLHSNSMARDSGGSSNNVEASTSASGAGTSRMAKEPNAP